MLIQENNCSMLMYIDKDEKTVYLADFYSVDENKGNFTAFLIKHIGLIKENYPRYLVYADCNAKGTCVSVKAGGRIKETLNRITF